MKTGLFSKMLITKNFILPAIIGNRKLAKLNSFTRVVTAQS
jgi:hypothetical protein